MTRGMGSDTVCPALSTDRPTTFMVGGGKGGGKRCWLTEAGETCSCSSVENDKVEGEGRVNPT